MNASAVEQVPEGTTIKVDLKNGAFVVSQGNASSSMSSRTDLPEIDVSTVHIYE